MKKKLLTYGLGLIAVIGIWTAWYARQPFPHEIRATRTFLQVDAPADKVWQVMTDFGAYPQWNPYVTQADGSLQEGATIHIKERVGGRTHRHTVELVQLHPELRTFVFKGGWVFRTLLHWDEGFRVESLDATHSVVTVSRAYQGWLLPLYWKIFNPYDLDAIRLMGPALRSRCEK